MTNFNGIPGGVNGYGNDVINSVIPTIEQMYRVSHSPAQRAFGGLSAGGERSATIMLNAPQQFSYFGIWSPSGNYNTTNLRFRNPALLALNGIHFGRGTDDTVVGNSPVKFYERVDSKSHPISKRYCLSWLPHLGDLA